MATEASLAVQSTDEVGGSKIIGNSNIGIDEEDIVSQPEQTEASEIEKDEVEEPASSETSAADPKEMIEIKDETFVTEEVKREDDDDTASGSRVLEDSGEDAPSGAAVKKETDSQVAVSEVVSDNKEASASEEVKKEDEDDTASASGVLEDKKDDKPAVGEPKEETSAQASGSEVLRDGKEASAAREVMKEDDEDTAGVLEDKKDDKPAVGEPKEETSSQASGSEVLRDGKEASAAREVMKEDDDDTAHAPVVLVYKEDAPFVLVDNKEDAPAVDAVKKETEDSLASGSEVLGDNKEASAAKEVKENEDDTPSAYVALEDKKEDAPAVVELKKETDSQASGSEVLEDNNDGASVVEDVKEESETGRTSSISDPEVEASIEGVEEKSTSTTESASEAVEKMLLDSSSSLVQESEHVGYEPKVSKPVVEVAKGIKESLDISANLDLASEAVAKSEGHPVALPVTESEPDAVGELEKQNETPEADDLTEAENDKHIATVEGKAVAEFLKEESVMEAESSASQALDTVPGDSAEVEAKDVGKNSVSENIEKMVDDTNAGGCQVEPKIEENEHNATESLGKEVTVDTSLPNALIAAGETGAIDSTSVTDAAEIVVSPEKDIEEQKGENIVGMELVKEQKEEKDVEEEPVKEQDQEKAVETGSILTATEEIETFPEKEKPSEDADEAFEQREKAPEVTEDSVKEPKLESVNIEENTIVDQTSRGIDMSGPATDVTEAASEGEKPSEGGDKVIEQRDLVVSDSAPKSVEILEKEKVSEVTEQAAEGPMHESENIMDNTALAQTSRDIDLGEQTNGTDASTREAVDKLDTENPSVDAGEKDETEKKDEAEKNDAQDLVEAPKDGADSRTNPEVQKAEASGKPSKTLMSKVKQSIVKVKKAIIGKSPSSKTMSAESRDELKVK